jgi:hypothetical protein
MVWDSTVDDPKLQEPLARYFRHLEERLAAELKRAVEAGELILLVPVEQVVLTILSMLQGSFTISCASQARRVDDVVVALRQVLDAIMVGK